MCCWMVGWGGWLKRLKIKTLGPKRIIIIICNLNCGKLYTYKLNFVFIFPIIKGTQNRIGIYLLDIIISNNLPNPTDNSRWLELYTWFEKSHRQLWCYRCTSWPANTRWNRRKCYSLSQKSFAIFVAIYCAVVDVSLWGRNVSLLSLFLMVSYCEQHKIVVLLVASSKLNSFSFIYFVF